MNVDDGSEKVTASDASARPYTGVIVLVEQIQIGQIVP